jgi:hypothetical protein
MKALSLGLNSEEEKKKKRGHAAVLNCVLSGDEIIYQEVQTDDVCGFQFRD